MVVKCTACGKFLSAAAIDGVSCSKCKKPCHKVCVGIPAGAQVNKSWMCPECKAKIPRDYSGDTPTKSNDVIVGTSTQADHSGCQQHTGDTDEASSLNSEALFSVWKKEMSEQMERFCNGLKQDFATKLDEVKGEFQAFRQEMLDVKQEVTNCSNRMIELEGRVKALEERADAGGDPAVLKEVQELENTVSQLKLELNDRDQELLQNDLDFTNISEESGENVIHVVMACAAKLGVTLEERDIVSCTRLGAVNTTAGGEPRPRPIAVKLARRATQDTILRAARVRRGATTEGIGARSEPRRFYVNERLTKRNRALFNRARKVRAAADWKYLWTQNGRINVRQNHGTQKYQIRSEADLIRVFGIDIVRSATAEA